VVGNRNIEVILRCAGGSAARLLLLWVGPRLPISYQTV